MIIIDKDKILKESKPLSKKQIKDVRKIYKKMKTICLKNDGVALAAPQVGVFYRFFITVAYLYPNTIFVNPKYEKEIASKVIQSRESCLSYGKDNLYLVNRYEKIIAEWYTIDFEYKTELLTGIEAIIFQHETDHLDGITVATRGKKI
jgi:peptide deformylase